ncbi:hypothetical protein CVT24_010969 [Panaeolus cyanescens]|uniref:Cytochrome P450 n=1 Tax=Panaeolus cyanescens TaxID=181874 RepID=A0A409WE80_9AGAR|nr:hypothetical protein CVT24_010969 [Panaeolus cyanescens]
MWPDSNAFVFLADAAAAKEVTTYRSRFPKPIEFYQSLAFFGQNILVTEGEQWKKYRKISAPAFTERNNQLVWNETISVVNELFSDVWGDKDVITVNRCLDLTLPITLFVISSAGFGQKISWSDDGAIPKGHSMSFKETMDIMSKDFMIPLALPKWALGVTKRTRNAGKALVELKKYISEMIHERIHSDQAEKADLFSMLLKENSQHLDTAALNDDELFGNIFVFLVAGYETTSHALAFTLGLLALYPDEQEKLFQHIKSVLPDGRVPTYADFNSLTYVLALYPPAGAIPKVAGEDTSINITNANGQVKRIPLPKGTYVNIHVAAIHKNPRYWPEPEAFKPARFLEPDWPRDAFFAFSAGSHACIGRRFAEVEVIAALTLFVSKYKITVKDEPQFANETFEERKERVMASDCGITLTPLGMPLTFTRR